MFDISRAVRSAIVALICCVVTDAALAQATCKGAPRKITVGVSVSPPNVVHTSAYVAKELGIFARHCLDVTIVQFDGGSSPAATVALTQGNTFATVSDVQIGRGMKVKQIWGLAPRAPQAYVVGPGITRLCRSQGQAAVRGRRRRRQLQLAHRSRGARQGRAQGRRRAVHRPRHRRPSRRPGGGPDRRGRAASGRRVHRDEAETRG